MIFLQKKKIINVTIMYVDEKYKSARKTITGMMGKTKKEKNRKT